MDNSQVEDEGASRNEDEEEQPIKPPKHPLSSSAWPSWEESDEDLQRGSNGELIKLSFPTGEARLVFRKMAETYSQLSLLDKLDIERPQQRMLGYYESVVKALAFAAEEQIKATDETDGIRDVMSLKETLDEFDFAHYVAACLIGEERHQFRVLGKGIMRASVMVRDSLKRLRIIATCSEALEGSLD